MTGLEQTETTESKYILKIPFKRDSFTPRILWLEISGYGSLVIIAFIMRLWDVGTRAMHHDESLHALHSWYLFKDLHYQHNPMMHGPFQFEANAAIFLILGDSDVTARLLYVIMGTVLVLMPMFFIIAGNLTFDALLQSLRTKRHHNGGMGTRVGYINVAFSGSREEPLLVSIRRLACFSIQYQRVILLGRGNVWFVFSAPNRHTNVS